MWVQVLAQHIRGAEHLRTFVVNDNVRAIQIHRRMGFVCRGFPKVILQLPCNTDPIDYKAGAWWSCMRCDHCAPASFARKPS